MHIYAMRLLEQAEQRMHRTHVSCYHQALAGMYTSVHNGRHVQGHTYTLSTETTRLSTNMGTHTLIHSWT